MSRPRIHCHHPTLFDLIKSQAERTPDATAFAAPKRTPLSYHQLLAEIAEIERTLQAIGVARDDCVAVTIPDGLEMAIAFLGVATSATCSPLNPAYTPSEFESFFRDLRPRALIVQQGEHCASLGVARRNSIPIVEISPIGTNAAATNSPTLTGYLPRSDDVALILFTSGTTSQPKMVPLTHSNLTASAMNIAASLRLTRDDRCLNIMPLFHIHGLVGALLSSLAAGGSVVCAPAFYAPEFFAWLKELSPTWYTATPTMHQLILARAHQHEDTIRRRRLRFIRSSSAPLPSTVLAQLEDTFCAPVIESYGMTEAAHQISSNPLPPRQRKCRSVGLAAGPEVSIIDQCGKFLPAGATGEVIVRGPNIMNEYANAPEANASAFVQGWFKTGDLGYIDSEGYLFLTGRLKEMINRGGEKIAPQEVDDVLMEHPAVLQAVTFPMPHTTLGEEVAAAVVLRENNVTAKDLREHAAARLAHFKVPRQLVIVTELPKGSTGKLQRVGLAAKLGITAAAEDPLDSAPLFKAPETLLENMIAAVWAKVLGVEEVGRHDDFLRLGGDSILAAQIAARLTKVWDAEVSMIDLLEARTVAALARALEAKRESGREPTPDLRPVSRDRPVPLSYAQQAVWLLHQLEPETAIYNRPSALRLTGALDVTALEQSFNELVHRHEALRTTFPIIDGEAAQAVLMPQRFRLSVVDLTAVSTGEREARAKELAIHEAQQPFDIAKGPLLRATLVVLDREDHILLVNLHHMISDGWSSEVLFHELGEFYTAIANRETVTLPPLEIQYGDYSEWQRDCMQGKRLQRLLEYWTRQLAGDLPRLDLPKRQSKTIEEANHCEAHYKLHLPDELARSLHILSQRENVTLFVTLLTTFKILLYRDTGQEDVLIGTPVAGRNREEVEGLIGNFINMLVIRTDLSRNPTFRELLSRVRTATLEAYAHQDLPFVKVTEQLSFQRSTKVPAPFGAIFELRNLPRRSFEFGGVQVESLAFDDGIAQFDFGLEVVQTNTGLSCTFEYETSLFDPALVVRMANHFQLLLEAIVADPDRRICDLPVLTKAERHQLLLQWNETAFEYSNNKCITDCFEAQVEKAPEAVAVVFEQKQLTYHELNERANQLAHYLRKRGVGPETLVPIHVERSIDMIVGLLGILKAGGAYVPLDPEYPLDRLEFMLTETLGEVLLTQEKLRNRLSRHHACMVCLDRDWGEIAKESKENPSRQLTADNLAYVIYTSGSTGKPKGVMITHGGLANYLNYCLIKYPVKEGRGSVVHSTFGFDATITALFAPLIAGRAVYILPQENPLEELATLLRRERNLSLVKITPAHLSMLSQQIPPQEAKGLTRAFVIGGEALHKEQIEFWQTHASDTQIFNEYGPTETVVGCIVHEATEWQSRGSIPIGRPIPNTKVYVLNQHHRPVPIGVTGELYLGGAGVARGYLGRPELTAESFIADPFSEDTRCRLYKTGDLARYWPDGNIEFMGRVDHQVKIRGYRIEVGEIEAVLCEHPRIHKTAVMARKDTLGNTRLLAYVTLSDGIPLNPDELRKFVRNKLPEYMIPSVFILMDSLPLTPNGKVDRKALPEFAALTSRPEGDYQAPRTEVEEVLEQIWLDVLGLKQVSIEDNFFDIGGHSLLAIKLISRLREEFQTDLSLRSVFESPTIKQLALCIEEEQKGRLATKSEQRGWKYLVELQAGSGQKPVFFLPGGYGGDFEFLVYARFVHHVGSDYSFYGLKAPSADGNIPCQGTVEELAGDYIREIRSIQPAGPYFLVGNCTGGIVAYEIAQQLKAEHEQIALLALMDTKRPTTFKYFVYRANRLLQRNLSLWNENYYVQRISFHWSELRKHGWRDKLAYLASKTGVVFNELPKIRRHPNLLSRKRNREESKERSRIKETYIETLRSYRPGPYEGRLVILINEKSYQGDPTLGWSDLIAGAIDVIKTRGDHETYIRENVRASAQQLRMCLEKVEL